MAGRFSNLLPRRFAGRLLFDPNDHELLAIVSDVMHRGDYPGLKRLLAPHLHPHGIKEMAAVKGLRVAYAMAHLLGSLEAGMSEGRISALRSVREEALYASQSQLRLNTARVLAQIMKELVRGRGSPAERLRLAHDFRLAMTGNHRFIRRQLAKYHLVEMPEEGNQISFDNHVHDANTKGRKSPTHLILDAWIKGIRSLTVIYYNYVEPVVARELLEAAEIMGLSVRIGIEFRPLFRGRAVKIIWVPRGFADNQSFLAFLDYPQVKRFLDDARKASNYHRWEVLCALDRFNETKREELKKLCGVELSAIEEEELLAQVGVGQLSYYHLGKLIYDRLLPLFEARVNQLAAEMAGADPQTREHCRRIIAEMENIDPEAIITGYLENGRDHMAAATHSGSGPEIPELMRIPPDDLVDRLSRLHSGHRFILNLDGLGAADVLEVLYDCRGGISHLEIVNLRNQAMGRCRDTRAIAELQNALSSGKTIRLKQVVQSIIDAATDAKPEDQDQLGKLSAILSDFSRLCVMYSPKAPLRTSIGSDSTGESRRARGMGLVVADTLPPQARKELEEVNVRAPLDIPVRMAVHEQMAILPAHDVGRLRRALVEAQPWLARFGRARRMSWVSDGYYPSSPGDSNILPLGGSHRPPSFFSGEQPSCRLVENELSWTYLNSHLKNGLKMLAGFVPAALTFALSKDWWVLAWFGAFIWFGVTGVRNIIQSVLGRGGLKRSPLLPWQSYMSWSRVADSLMYTGFSVPLLDYLVKTVILERDLGLTAASAPLLVYFTMSLANGLYICGHNLLRSLPGRVAAINLFRSILSTPLAMLVSIGLTKLLIAAGAPDAAGIIQQWAAIISKFSSDCVAAVIEGQGDRATYVRLRFLDYAGKLRRLFETYSQLEVLFPKEKTLNLLEAGGKLPEGADPRARDLELILTVHALDFLYFWMYQPRSRTVLTRFIREMPREERRVFLLSQYILLRQRDISELFLDGLVGKNFSKPLAFYLDNARPYLDAIQDLCGRDYPSEYKTIAAIVSKYHHEHGTPVG